MSRAGHPRPPHRPEQHLLQRQPRRHPRHPRRALGQVHLRRPRLGLRRLGRPARGKRDLRQGLHLHARPEQGHLRPARRGQLLPGPGGRHRLHLPGGRPLVTGAQEDLHLREPRRPRARHRVADPPRRGHRLRGRPQPPDAEGRRPHGAEAHPRHRLRRPAGPRGARARRGARRGEGLRLLRHRHLRHVRPGGLRAVRLVALRHRDQLRRLHRRG